MKDIFDYIDEPLIIGDGNISMTPNRRIFLNIIAMYGRSLYALVCGLFTARWVLEALGQVNFGLYGLVG